MGKYGALINQARSQETIEPENQKTRKPESKKARKPVSKKTRKPENQTAGDANELVNLGVKVRLDYRRHWAAESKREGVSMTEIIIEALTRRFGKPE